MQPMMLADDHVHLGVAKGKWPWEQQQTGPVGGYTGRIRAARWEALPGSVEERASFHADKNPRPPPFAAQVPSSALLFWLTLEEAGFSSTAEVRYILAFRFASGHGREELAHSRFRN